MIEYNFDTDEDVLAVKNFHLAERQVIMDRKKEEMKLSAEELVYVKEVCDEIGAVDGSPDMTGYMAYDEYVKIFTAVIKVQVALIKKIEETAREERAVHLAGGAQQAFAQSCMKMLQD